MWLTDLLPGQTEPSAESAPHPAADDRGADDPARPSSPAVRRQRPASPDQAGGLHLVFDLESGRAWYELHDDGGKDSGKRSYLW